MSPLSLVTFGGMLVAAGLVAAVAALRPAPPKLSVALARLNAPSAVSNAAPVTLPGRWTWLPAPAAQFVTGHIGVSDEDLAILNLERPQLVAMKLTRTAAGLLAPSVVAVLLSLGGHPPVFVLPLGSTLLLAVVLWLVPSGRVRKRAARARGQFRAALRAYLKLVAQERAARGSPTEALEEASRGWQAWPFGLIHTEVLRAELSGQQPWLALRELGTRLGVAELRNMAEIVSTAADGAAVFDTLLAEARNLHHAELSMQRAEANATSERLIQPIGLLAFGFVVMLLIPPLLRLYAS